MGIFSLLSSVFFAALVVSLCVLLVTRARAQRASEQRASISEALDRLKKERDELNLNLWAAVEKTRDVERKKIAQELHDGLGADLTEMQHSISLMRKDSLTPVEQRMINHLLNSVALLSRKIRTISSGQSAERVEEIGLVASLQEFLMKKDGVGGVSFHFETLGSARDLIFPKALSLFRLVQEIVANSLKHAKCENVWIRIFWEDNRIVLEAEDDGRTEGSKVASKAVRRRVDQLNVKIVNLDEFKGLHVQIIFDGW